MDDAVKSDSAVTVAALRLKADTIKWKLARMSPKKYSDRQQITHEGNMNVTLFDGKQIS